MKIKLIIAAVSLGSVFSAYAMDTSDVEDVSMQPVDSVVELPEAAMRELSLPETASERAVERAQQREGYGLSRANMARGVMPDDMPDEPDPGDNMDGDMDGDMNEMDDMNDNMETVAEISAHEAVDAAETVANATAMAQEAVANASEHSQNAVANATDKAQEAIANARNAAANAAEQASSHRPGS